MTTRKARAALDRIYRQPETEAGWQGAVIHFAILRRWRIYHTRNSKGSHAGYPDLTLVRGPRLVFAELKTDQGRVTVDQREWLDALAATGAEAYVWRPRDWPNVRTILD